MDSSAVIHSERHHSEADWSVTVVVPTFNRAHLLRETVDAILAQTVLPDEILIIDDGSTDDTADVCRTLPHPVRAIYQSNTGLPGARNRGIAEARSAWIAFCDSDDLWHPRKLEVQLAALRAVPRAQWCLTGCRRIDPEGRMLPSSHAGFIEVFPVFREKRVVPETHFAHLDVDHILVDGDTVRVYHGDIFNLLFQGNVALPSSAIVARHVISRTGGFDPEFQVAEETEFFHRVAAIAPVAILIEPLVEYRVGHPSIVHTGDPTRLIDNAIRSSRKAAALRPVDSGAQAAFREGLRTLYSRLAYARLTALDRAGARAALRHQARLQRVPPPRSVLIFLASLLPSFCLRWLHQIKRFFL